MGSMRKEHVKAIRLFFDRMFLSDIGNKFVKCKGVRKTGLNSKGISYCKEYASFFAIILIDAAHVGKAPGFNLYIAWANSKERIHEFIRTDSSVAEVRAEDSILAENIWDPLWSRKRDDFFGFFSFKAREFDIEEIINSEGDMKYDDEEAISDVKNACQDAWGYISNFLFPFFDKLPSLVGEEFTRVSEILTEYVDK